MSAAEVSRTLEVASLLLRRRGFAHPTLEAQARAAFMEYTHEAFLAALADTGGDLLSERAHDKGIDAESLFSGPETRARKWASSALHEWWSAFGRPDFVGFCAELWRQAEVERVSAGRIGVAA